MLFFCVFLGGVFEAEIYFGYHTAYSFLFGWSSSGKVVNERTAMQTMAVYSCVRILSGAVASLSVHLYRYAGKGKIR